MENDMTYHNIEKSAFRPKEYVGYADGVWRIRNESGRWLAMHRERRHAPFYRLTLREVSAALDKVHQ